MIDVGTVVRTNRGKLTATVVQRIHNMALLDQKLEGVYYWPVDLLVEVAGSGSCPDADKKTSDLE